LVGGLRDIDVHRERDRLGGQRLLGAVLGRLEVAREVVEPQRDKQPDVIRLQAEVQRVLALLDLEADECHTDGRALLLADRLAQLQRDPRQRLEQRQRRAAHARPARVAAHVVRPHGDQVGEHGVREHHVAHVGVVDDEVERALVRGRGHPHLSMRDAHRPARLRLGGRAGRPTRRGAAQRRLDRALDVVDGVQQARVAELEEHRRHLHLHVEHGPRLGPVALQAHLGLGRWRGERHDHREGVGSGRRAGGAAHLDEL
jgi:hypothetical protein